MEHSSLLLLFTISCMACQVYAGDHAAIPRASNPFIDVPLFKALATRAKDGVTALVQPVQDAYNPNNLAHRGALQAGKLAAASVVFYGGYRVLTSDRAKKAAKEAGKKVEKAAIFIGNVVTAPVGLLLELINSRPLINF